MLKRAFTTVPTPHPSLTYIPSFLPPASQSLLLQHSLRLLSSPASTTSLARKRAKTWRKSNPSYDASHGFMGDDAYVFEERHFDGVIEGYREQLVKSGQWGEDDEELGRILSSIYALLPPNDASSTPTPSTSKTDPPSHLLLHLLHLSSNGAIYPHVDNLKASGSKILGVTLGGERVMRFKKSRANGDVDGPDAFEVLVEPGSVYIQSEPLRTHYTHDIPRVAMWEGREVGGTQRLSLMLRDRLENA